MQRFLFDRLCAPLQPEPTDEFSQLALLRQSITEELQRLVSGRAYFDGIKPGYMGHKSVLNWGIDSPVDFGNNYGDAKILMDQILELIRAFEPRIINPKVQLRKTNNQLSPAAVEISGQIKVDRISAPFNHKISFSGARQ
ncbi:GPW/gp25 family protein [Paraneptunicella aestuarii]|uniref:hypothetical protein n=1 Tax=Paraneptunicella aestuarii TaxID=2831148 RepID=UPI001E39A88F|nr:hypothetical protein [Paraneptunicella aestuarii]UAA40643.1 GPW/gp25 family protein [Paraneptunicella aestuarii]